MSTERLLVVGLDGSPAARRALDWALRHAGSTGSTVQVVTADTRLPMFGAVWAPAGFDSAAVGQRRVVAEALAEVEDPPVVSMEVVDDEPVDALVRAARGADMLVLGTHRRGPVGQALFGSVATQCIRKVTTAVVVVPSAETDPEPEELVRADVGSSGAIR